MTMAPKRISIAALTCFTALLLSGGAQASMAATPHASPTADAGVIVLQLPAELGELQRPPVAFDHAEHVEELKEQGCAACHDTDADGMLIPRLGTAEDEDCAKSLRNHYHDTCIGCHEKRADEGLSSGPNKCAKCHKKGAVPVPERKPIRFDYSLHHRHNVAMDEKCETCHHVYDENAKKLVYVKGEENACDNCHKEEADGNKPSLKDVSHASCVACHVDKKKNELAAGPVLCGGCHDSAQQAKIAKLPEVPRLMRGQKDIVWIDAPGSESRMVAYDHKAHENNAEFCTTCHLQKPQRCGQCHSTGSNLPHTLAFHTRGHGQSCVGCHEAQAERQDCAGCHGMPRELPSQSSCKTCHSGPLPRTEPLPTPAVAKVILASLPASSETFPETVTIDRLKNHYEATIMPHRKIVAHLDALVREDGLATHFHGQLETLCAGCHHHSPVGERPPPCSSCHTEEIGGIIDKPTLRAAYHRQCVGCHQRMKIEEQSCTACHAKMPEELSK